VDILAFAIAAGIYLGLHYNVLVLVALSQVITVNSPMEAR
jgi:hypothetical protein